MCPAPNVAGPGHAATLTMKNELPDDQLNSLLREWKVDAEPNPRLADGVWRRIAQREADKEAASLPARCRRWMSALFTPRTGFAWGATAALAITLTSAWLGHRSADTAAAAPTAEHYLASVDPYRMTP